MIMEIILSACSFVLAFLSGVIIENDGDRLTKWFIVVLILSIISAVLSLSWGELTK